MQKGGRMRNAIIVLLVIVGLLPAMNAHSANRALLIGVGDYQLKGANLPGIDKDIEMMREVALVLGYKSSEIKILLDKEATLNNIQSAIDNWLIKGVGKSDHVLFYFSGHGSQIYDKNKDEADKADEVLVTHDAAIGVNTLKNVFVDDMFNEMLARIPSENVFIFIDACHSGTATRGISSSTKIYPKYLEYPGMPRTTRSVNFAAKSIQGLDSGTYSALSAAQDNQRAQASNQGSFFTRGVSDAILEARRLGRPITMLTLHDQTTEYVSSQLKKMRLVQKPVLVGSAGNNQKNLFISKSSKPQQSPPSKPPAQNSWADEIQKIVDKAAYTVRVGTNAKRFNVGNELVISCVVSKGGYVNVITMQPGDKVPTVLYPNKYHKKNWVSAGQSLTIPAPGDAFVLKAAPLRGRPSLPPSFPPSRSICMSRDTVTGYSR